MDIKKIIGAVLGIVIVAGLWFMFSDDAPPERKTSLENGADSGQTSPPLNQDDEKTDEGASSTGEERDDASATGEGKDDSSATGVVKDDSSATGVVKDDSSATGVVKDDSSATGVVKDDSSATGVVKDDDAATESMDVKPGQEAASADPRESGNRQDFWTPFKTMKKAKGFAEYVTSVSGVDCGARKVRATRYQVYFTYEDELDRKTKIADIEKAGLDLDLGDEAAGKEARPPAGEKDAALHAETDGGENQVGDDPFEESGESPREPEESGDAPSESEPGSTIASLQTPPPSDQNQQDIWKPFNAKGKAKGFATHITTTSGVECQVKKTGPGRHQVYFEYDDELDRKAKIAMIEEAGVSLDLEEGKSD
ncbi:MAG: hypothetical protein GY859_19190 [Desulfobacterales bacterium]|nr:hypothetical protein [Desulfobacterales bacterium]